MLRTPIQLLLIIPLALCVNYASAESKRVHVYQVPQQTWQVSPGDTLSGIAGALLPGSRVNQHSLMKTILEINPDAFIDHNPNLLRAYVRLVLPDNVQTYSVPAESGTTRVQQFSWGSIQRHDP